MIKFKVIVSTTDREMQGMTIDTDLFRDVPMDEVQEMINQRLGALGKIQHWNIGGYIKKPPKTLDQRMLYADLYKVWSKGNGYLILTVSNRKEQGESITVTV